MRILIANDGSDSANYAILDIKNAGLNECDVEACVVSVSEIWFPDNAEEEDKHLSEAIKQQLKKPRQRAEAELKEARADAAQAAATLRAQEPRWRVTERVETGTPSWAIIDCAYEIGANLIVVGAQGKTAIERFVFGSTSLQVVSEAKCSVRVSRRHEIAGDGKILVGFDGSPGSVIALEEVGFRKWKVGTKIRVVSVDEGENDYPGIDDLKLRALIPLQRLEKDGLDVGFEFIKGEADSAILDFAENWDADTIFVGAHSYSILERYLIGATSSKIAEKAACSVEIVRRRK